MKISKKKNKYIITTLLFVGFIGAIFVLVPGINVKGNIGWINEAAKYKANYGGRITDTRTMAECENSYSCAGVCSLCGCGPWFQVVFDPAGGSGFSVCPEFLATKGNNPAYTPGGYILTGGSDAHSLDASNTGSVLGSNYIRGNLMLVWFRILDLFS